MRYIEPELLDRLAREYVLGTLRGAARRRFEAVCRDNEAARRSVQEWEDRLLGLSLALEAVQPSMVVWNGIRRRVGLAARGTGVSSPVSGGWRFAVAAMLALAVAGLSWMYVTRTGDPAAIARLAPEGGPAIWNVETYPDRGRVRIVVAGEVPVQVGRSYELWALPEGGAPVSLGLMPTGRAEMRRLSDAQQSALGLSRQVAVSLEPAGGSPTGAPTGPVLYVAALAT
jgi:anti-sigma-K factor RskA